MIQIEETENFIQVCDYLINAQTTGVIWHILDSLENKGINPILVDFTVRGYENDCRNDEENYEISFDELFRQLKSNYEKLSESSNNGYYRLIIFKGK